MKVLIFDIWGDFAHFKKFYTTTSPLTLSFPPPPTIAGILGAIYGAEKLMNEYLHLFVSDDSLISVQILTPIKKLRFGINLHDTRGTNLRHPLSDKRYARTLIRTEFIREPRFRIYFTHKDPEVYQKILSLISQHKSVYSVSLGLSELLANFEFIGEVEYEEREIENDYVEVVTPIISSNLQKTDAPILIEDGKKYFSEKMPVKMTPSRVVTKYDEAFFEPDGKSIKAKLVKYQRLSNGDNIAFF
jgi:CRISPR-associated protein Cas5h